MIKIFTQDGSEMVAGQDYYKIDTYLNRLKKVKMPHSVMATMSDVALQVDDDKKEITLHFYYTDLSKAYEALYNHIQEQYERDIREIYANYSLLKSE